MIVKALQLSIFHITAKDSQLLFKQYDKDQFPYGVPTSSGFIIKPITNTVIDAEAELNKLKFSPEFIKIYLEAISNEVKLIEFDSDHKVSENLTLFDW